MSLVAKLIGFGFRQVLGAGAGQTAEIVVGAVEKHITDHGQTLPKALARANDRAGIARISVQDGRHSWP
jgi:hypothetical protein